MSALHWSGRGRLWHARHRPRAHKFQYPTAMVLLDLDRLDVFEGSRLAVNKKGLVSLRTERHLIDDQTPSGDQARAFVRTSLDVDVSGPVRLLTNPHVWGVGFNPLSMYFLHDRHGAPAALIYEVSNTPWNEIYRYVVPADAIAQGATASFEKTFHVSPFNPMDQRYVSRVHWPDGERVSVYLGLEEEGSPDLLFEAGLSLTLSPYHGQSRKPLFLGVWPQTFVVLAGIYREAFALWRKGVPYHSHP